jgi:hypothetical protein
VPLKRPSLTKNRTRPENKSPIVLRENKEKHEEALEETSREWLKKSRKHTKLHSHPVSKIFRGLRWTISQQTLGPFSRRCELATKKFCAAYYLTNTTRLSIFTGLQIHRNFPDSTRAKWNPLARCSQTRTLTSTKPAKRPASVFCLSTCAPDYISAQVLEVV